MSWDKLSMAEKAEIMKLAVQDGIYNLDAIRNGYNEYAKGGKIHIAPSKRGTFTAAASKHGKSVQAFASQVLAHPENYSPAMRKKANFARNAAKWKHGNGGNLYGGETQPTQQMITTGGAGYIPNFTVSPVDMLRQKIYKSVSPNDSYKLDNFFTQLLSDNDVYKDYKDVFDSTDKFYPEDETNKAHRQSYNIADEMLATYLSIPKKDRHSSVRLKKSKYQNAYALPLHESMKKNIIDETNDLSIGENKSVILNGPIGLGYTAVGKGYDSKGEYRSYGDRYDLNPARGKLKSINIPFLESIGDVSMGIGKPFDIYDRIYLDDYYGVPKEHRGGRYLPEITITGKKKKKASGGNIGLDLI